MPAPRQRPAGTDSTATSDPHQIHIGSTSDLHRVHIGSTSDPHQIHIGSTSDPHRIHIGSTSGRHRVHIESTSGSTSGRHRIHIGSTSGNKTIVRGDVAAYTAHAVYGASDHAASRLFEPGMRNDAGESVSQFCSIRIMSHPSCSVTYAFGTVPGVWQQIQGRHDKAASMPCCCAANPYRSTPAIYGASDHAASHCSSRE